MLPPAAPSLVYMNEFLLNDGEFLTYEQLFLYMSRVADGRDVRLNVITDVNPFNHLPETLPGDNMWYYMNAMENRGAVGGFWKRRGEPRQVFADASINGWEAIHEFYVGQGPHAAKTNWLMLEYYTTPKVSGDAVLARDASSLCKVFRDRSSPLSDSGMLQNVAATEFRRENCIFSLHPDNFNIPVGEFLNTHMHLLDLYENNHICRNFMQGRLNNFLGHPLENLPALEPFDPDDYFTLEDFGIPLSPSSGSDNSSCMTMLSDERFDYLDQMLDEMLDFEAESGDHVEQKNTGSNLSFSDSSRIENIAIHEAISGWPIEEGSSENAIDGKAVDVDSGPWLTLGTPSSGLLNISQTPSADGRNKNDGRLAKLKRKYLPSSSSQSSSEGSNSSRAPSPGPDGRTKTDGTFKKLQKKYLCFMPF